MAEIGGPEVWVVGIDGSDNSEVALRWAIARAASSTAAGRPVRIRIVAAWNTAALSAVKVDEMDAAVRTRVGKIVGAVDHHGVAIEVVITRRGAAEALIDASTDAELLVVGSRGVSGLRELVLGSVSRQCATHAEVPTVVVPEHAPLGPIRSVVVGYDGSPHAERALTWVDDNIDRFATDPQIVAVYSFDIAAHADPTFMMGGYPDVAAEAERDFLQAMSEREPGGRVTARFTTHGARHAIVDGAQHAQLVVLGARGHGAFSSALLGSVSTWVLHHTPCALVVVPE